MTAAPETPVERAVRARKPAPSHCPYCGGTEVAMEVVAWGQFRDGTFLTFDVGEEISFLPEVTAVCLNENCGGEFLWRQA